MSVDVVIVNFNTCGLLRECLESVARVHGEVFDIHTIVVDNASADDSVEMVRSEFPGVELVMLPENLGFGAGNNRGVEKGRGEYILFLNSDAQLTPGALAVMTAYLDAHHECVAVGPRLIYPDGTFQPSCRRFPTVWRYAWSLSGMAARMPKTFRSAQSWLTEDEHSSGRRVDMVSGACFLMRRSFLDEIGGFDENLFLYEEEFDLFFQASKKRLVVRYLPDAEVVHAGGQSVKWNELRSLSLFHLFRSKYYVFRKHYGRLRSWATYSVDRAILASSSVINFLLGRENTAVKKLEICHDAYSQSFCTNEKDPL